MHTGIPIIDAVLSPVLAAAGDPAWIDVFLDRAGKVIGVSTPIVGMLAAAARWFVKRVTGITDAVKALSTDLSDVKADLAGVKAQVQNNGGKSLLDVAERTEAKIDANSERLARLEGRFDEHARQNDE